jgi:hypothetical protein
LRYRQRNATPAFSLGFELLPSGLGQAIKLGATIVFRVTPIRGNPTFFLHPVEGGKKRAWLNNESATADELDSA